MRPPICELCRRPARETVSVVDYVPLPEGMVGHPRGLGWFCRRHLRGARSLRGRTMGRAIGILRARTILWLVAGVMAVVAALAWILRVAL